MSFARQLPIARGEHYAAETVTRWLDTDIVYFVSSFYSADNSGETVRRRSKGGADEIAAPLVAKMYNDLMGGVDAFDARRAARTVDRPRTRKWTTKVWFFAIDVAATNAAICNAKAMRNKDAKEATSDVVRLALVRQLLDEADRVEGNGDAGSTSEGASVASPTLSVEEMKHAVHHHFPVMGNFPTKDQRSRCCVCKEKSFWACSHVACGNNAYCVSQNRNCFFKFHIKPYRSENVE